MRPPTVYDIQGSQGNYPVGQRWIDQTANASYTLTSFGSSSGVTLANWVTDGSGSGAIATLTGNSGGTISPVSGNINILGSGLSTVVGSGSTLTIQATSSGYPITPYVVGPSGNAGFDILPFL